MGGGGGQAAGAPALGGQGAAVALPVAFEPQDGRAEHAALAQRLADAGLDGAQVLADHQRPGPGGLQDQHGEHGLGVVADVGALRGRVALRHPPQAEQAHDVVDAQGPGVTEEGPEQFAERGVARRGQAVGAPGRQAPVLAAGVEGVRRRAHRHPGGEVLPLCPGVGATGVHADREVVHDADGHAGLASGALRRCELGVGEPGEPGPEVDPVHEASPRAGRVGRAGVAQAGRPAVPVRAVHLGERAPGGVVLQGLALFGEEVAVGGAPAGAERHVAQQLECLALELPHGVPIDQRALLQHRRAQPAGLFQQGVEALAVLDVGVLGDVLDPQVHRVGEAA